MTLAFSISYTLHLAVPIRCKAFDIVYQGDDGLLYDEDILKKHGKEIKMFTLPVKITSTLKRLLFFKVAVSDRMGVLPHPQNGRITPHW